MAIPNQTGRKTKFRKKGARQKRHVFNFESRLQGFVQIKSLIAGTGCCKCPAFPAFLFTWQRPFKTLQERSRSTGAATLSFVPTFYFVRILKDETDEFAYLINRYKLRFNLLSVEGILSDSIQRMGKLKSRWTSHTPTAYSICCITSWCRDENHEDCLCPEKTFTVST